MDKIQTLINRSSVLYSEAEIKNAINHIAYQVNQSIAMNGALIFAGQLLPQIKKNIQYQYIHATRYENSLTGDSIRWLVMPPKDIENRTVLILDDILDEGITLNEMVSLCRTMNAKEIYTAVLFDKELEKNKSHLSDFTGLKVPNRFVFGYGLDCKGLGRNLPHLYALN